MSKCPAPRTVPREGPSAGLLGRSESITQPLLEKSGTMELPRVGRVTGGRWDGLLLRDQLGCGRRRPRRLFWALREG